eukprot:g33478.t1
MLAFAEAEGGRLPVLSPVDGKPFASIAHASARDVDRAVQSARRCFDHDCWPQQDVQARVEILKRIAAALRTPEVCDALCVIESRDCGKPFSESQGDLGVCADTFDYYAEVAPETMKTTYPSVGAGATHFYARIAVEPLGVVGCITPWNFPLMQAVLKVAPALAAGCAVVLKPSPLASRWAEGALNVITGGPPEVLEGGGSTGQYLIDHSMLDKVSFTGSGSAGQKMLEASASKLRPTCLVRLSILVVELVLLEVLRSWVESQPLLYLKTPQMTWIISWTGSWWVFSNAPVRCVQQQAAC